MNHSKTIIFLKSLLVATCITLASVVAISISRLLNLLPFPWGEVANIVYGIAFLTTLIYIVFRKMQKE